MDALFLISYLVTVVMYLCNVAIICTLRPQCVIVLIFRKNELSCFLVSRIFSHFTCNMLTVTFLWLDVPELMFVC